MKSQREPRWKQLGFARSNSHDRSHVSKRSSRYTPKKSVASSEKQFSLSHLHGNSVQLSDGKAFKIHQDIEKILPDDRHVVHYSQKFDIASQSGKNMSSKIQRFDSGGGGSSLEGISAIYPKGPDAAKPAQARKITDKNRQNSGNSGSSTSFPFICNPAVSPEENFKQCLKYLQKNERDLINKKSEIERTLNEKQQQFNKAKKKLMEKFQSKFDEIHDQNLQKVLLKFIDSKFKSPPKPLFRLTSAGDVSHQVLYHRQSQMNSDKQSYKYRSKRSIEESAYKQNIERIVGAMSAMKQRLNGYTSIINEDLKYEED